MKQTAQNKPPVTAGDLEGLVAATGRQLRRNRLLMGAALLVLGVLGWLTAAGVTDMLLPLPVAARVLVCVVLWLAALFVGVFYIAMPLMRPPTALRVASRIEGVSANMHNRLITVIDVRRRHAEAEHAGMFESLVEQTCLRLADYGADRVADPRPARHALVCAALTVVVAAVLLGSFHGRLPGAYARMLRPTAPIPPPTWVRFHAVPGDVEVLRGEPVAVRAVFDRGAAGRMFLCMRAAGEAWVTYPMEAEGGGFRFDISRLDRSCEYYVKGARTWTLPHRITAVDRPAIESMAADITLPDYMGLKRPRPVHRHATQISAPVGSMIRIMARVTGDPTQGFVHHYTSLIEERETQRVEESVWFDDSLPADAVVEGIWRWSESRAFSGGRAHTFDWSRQPYGFTTRLHGLTLQPDDSISLYARLDAQEPPGAIRVTFHIGSGQAVAVWEGGTNATPLAPGAVRAGTLPVPGEWARLETRLQPLADAAGLGVLSNAVELAGIQFAVDRGRAWFDRVAGLRTYRERREERELRPSYTLDMSFDEKTGQWVGFTYVQTDTHFDLRFVDARGHRNSPMRPFPVLATTDRPPSLVVEKPGRDVTVTGPEPVPAVARVFDDYGVASVGIELGPGPDKLQAARWIAEYEEPRTSRIALTGVDPGKHGIRPGEAVHYRFVARDSKGQTAHSDVFRVSLATTQDVAQADQALPLRGLLDDVGKLFDFSGRLVDPLTGLLAQLPDAERPEIRYDGVLILVDPGGRRMDREQVRAFFEALQPNMTAEQKQHLEAINAMLAEQRALTEVLLSQLDAAAGQAEASALGLPYEETALRRMAERARLGMGAEGAPGDLPGFLAWQAAPRDDALRLGSRAALAGIQSQLQDLLKSHDLLGGDSEDAGLATAARMVSMRSDYALDDLETLGGIYSAQAQEFETLRERLATLRRQAESAPVDQLAAVSDAQRELDGKALELLQRARDLMDERRDRGEDAVDLPAAPWAPPGRVAEAMPVEQDTPPEAQPAGGGTDPAREALTLTELEELLNETPEWWDRPVRMRSPSGGSPLAERFEGRGRAVADGDAEGGEDGLSPRDMLTDHQDGLDQRLTAEAGNVRRTLNVARRMAGEIRSMVDELQVTDLPLSTRMRSRAIEQTMARLASPRMAGMMNMAAIARMRQLGLEPSAAWAGGRRDRGGADGLVVGVFADGLEQGSLHRAGLYRLPPELREPLIQGLQERAPEGYRHLVDTYYRELSREDSN